ncbi:MAG: hypothetical protein N3D12_05620 [Candidatus Methanomethyliaceae archaeon]|nr:hypothetical protein [Candidatus Methanomethyliaceae archaeon]
MKTNPLKILALFLTLTASLVVFLYTYNMAISAIIVAVLFLLLFYLFYVRCGRKFTTYELILFTHTMELFVAVYTLSGSIKQSIQYLCRREYPFSERFRAALLRIRNGSDLTESLRWVFRGNARYNEWFTSLASGSISDAQDLFSMWESSAEEAILKVDDLLSFVIVFSTLLPVVIVIMLMVFGAKPPFLYLLVIFQILLFQGVYRWIRDLFSLL